MTNRSQTLRNKKQRIYKRDGGICHYCGVLCDPFKKGVRNNNNSAATVDHVQTKYEGGGNHDANLVLACLSCNNSRSCVPYDIFVHQELWRPENAKQLKIIRDLFCEGANTVKLHTANVWLLEMYYEAENCPITVQNWGVFSTADKVHKHMAKRFPDAKLNEDDGELGYIGYHFDEGHPLADVSFVANAWDLQ